jgi:hypothetical protein
MSHDWSITELAYRVLAAGAPTRWAFLFAYRSPLPYAVAAREESRESARRHRNQQWGSVIPAQWMRRMDVAIAEGTHAPWSERALDILGAD